jgi:vacuolar-type H+-ATPase subunit H
MTGLEIAALVAMVAGAGMQYKATQDARSRQDASIRESLARQRELQQQAEQKAMSTAREYGTEDRRTEQTQIADQITQELLTPVSESQAIRSQQSTTQGNVSNDYSTAKAASDVQSLKAAEQLARLLGKSTSANRLRMNEGIRLMDAGQAIDQLGSFSRGNQAADQIAITQAGRPDAGLQFAGSVLQGVGSAGFMAGGSAGKVTGADLAAANATADPIATLNASKSWTGSGNTSWLDALRRIGQ